MTQWYFCKLGKQEGPFTLDELKTMIGCGDLEDRIPVWEIGTSQWIKIRKHPKLISSIPKPPSLLASSTTNHPSQRSIFGSIISAIRSTATR